MLNAFRCYSVIGRSDPSMNGPISVEYFLETQMCIETCEYVQIQSSNHLCALLHKHYNKNMLFVFFLE